MLLTLQITLGVFLGEILFTLATTTFLAYRRRNQKDELQNLLNQLGLRDTQEDEDVPAGV